MVESCMVGNHQPSTLPPPPLLPSIGAMCAHVVVAVEIVMAEMSRRREEREREERRREEQMEESR